MGVQQGAKSYGQWGTNTNELSAIKKNQGIQDILDIPIGQIGLMMFLFWNSWQACSHRYASKYHGESS